MANRPFVSGLRTLDNELVMLTGKVTFGATSTVASQDTNGFTVTALGTGTFTVTFGNAAQTDKYAKLYGFTLQPLVATATDSTWQLITDTVESGTLTIRNTVGATATAPATGAVLYCTFILYNSAQPRKGA